MHPGPSRHALAPNPGGERTARLILLISMGAIALMTLVPSDGGRSAALTPLFCLVCGDFGAIDVLLNTALFVPFGLSLGLLRLRWSRLLIAAVLLTLGIELLQLTVIPGRDASLSDVMTNTLGAALGAGLAIHWRRVLAPDPRTARALFAAALLGWVGARLSTSWLLRPSFPDTRWYGQVAPVDVYPFDFRGTVLRGELEDVPVRSAEMPELHAAFRAPTLSVRAVVTAAKPTRGLASVLSVLDEHRSEILLLGQEAGGARLRFRLRAADLRLRTPSLRLERAIVASGDGTTELRGRFGPGVLSLESRSAAGAFSSTLPLGPGLGWALLMPFDFALTPSSARAGTAVCTALAVLVLGFFAGRAVPDRPSVAVGVLAAAGAIGLSLPLVVFPETRLAMAEALAALLGVIFSAGLRAAFPPIR